MEHREDVTHLLKALSDGDEAAMDRLIPIIYDELRRIAHRQLRGERRGHTLETTALVHEAYLKLARLNEIEWQNRAHFFALAAQAMRRILINYAVRRNAQKRGGGQPKVPLDQAVLVSEDALGPLLALDDALQRLKEMDERQARVVEYRFFGGLTIEETAEVLGVSTATIKRDWRAARAWLNRELSEK